MVAFVRLLMRPLLCLGIPAAAAAVDEDAVGAGDPKEVDFERAAVAVDVDALYAGHPKEVDFVTEGEVFLPLLKNY